MASEKVLSENDEEVESGDKKKKPKVLNLKQLLAKKFPFLSGLAQAIISSFGNMTSRFIMLIWGDSGNGKTNFVLELVKMLMPHGTVLYVSLEEGHEASMQLTALQHLCDDVEAYSGRIKFADHEMTYDELVKRLSKKKSEQFIVIDSIQYWDITIAQYKRLKERFKNKSFIFISHSKGSKPDGVVANKIRFDATYKIFIKDFIAFIRSRTGGNKPYLIWEEGAKDRYGEKKFNEIFKIKKIKKTKEKQNEKVKKSNEENTTDHSGDTRGSTVAV